MNFAIDFSKMGRGRAGEDGYVIATEWCYRMLGKRQKKSVLNDRVILHTLCVSFIVPSFRLGTQGSLVHRG